MSIPAKRSRATHEQLSHMVDFMYDNPGFTGAKSLKFYGRLERDRIWSELAEVLNSFSGAVKTVEQWQSVWKDLKSRTSTKVRNKKNQKAGNGKNTSYQEPITDLEKRVIAVIGRDYIESSSEKELEHEEEIFSEIASTSACANDTNEMPHKPIKRQYVEEDECSQQKDILEVLSKQADALKALAEANTANADMARKQADALKLLAECSARNIKTTQSMAESIKSITEGIKANAVALNNLANAVNRIGNMPFFTEKRKRTEREESIIFPSAFTKNYNNVCNDDEHLENSSMELESITVKSEQDD